MAVRTVGSIKGLSEKQLRRINSIPDMGASNCVAFDSANKRNTKGSPMTERRRQSMLTTQSEQPRIIQRPWVEPSPEQRMADYYRAVDSQPAPRYGCLVGLLAAIRRLAK